MLAWKASWGVASATTRSCAAATLCVPYSRNPWLDRSLARPLLDAQARPGARVSQKFASRAILVFPKTSPAPQVPAVPPREPPLEPRPAGTVPECVPPWLATHTRRGQSSRRERVARRRRMRRGGCGYRAPLRRSEVGRRPSRVRSDILITRRCEELPGPLRAGVRL